MMLNPEILEKSKETFIEKEWCLSVPWEKWQVERCTQIKIKFTDLNKRERTLILIWVSSVHHFGLLQD
jgi:peptide deformylase